MTQTLEGDYEIWPKLIFFWYARVYFCFAVLSSNALFMGVNYFLIYDLILKLILFLIKS